MPACPANELRSSTNSDCLCLPCNVVKETEGAPKGQREFYSHFVLDEHDMNTV